jgi:enolase
MPRRKIYTIQKITAREILDSRGNPTIEAEVVLDTNDKFKASVPSGASVGVHEAVELRDNDEKRYHGLGVLKACKKINNKISKELRGLDVIKQVEIDKKLIKLDGTKNKSKLGANATLAVSLACCRAGAFGLNLELYEYIRKTYGIHGIPSAGSGQALPHPDSVPTSSELHRDSSGQAGKTPIPMFNIFNGGKHGDTNLDLQEFMIVPILDVPFKEKVRIGAEIFHKLGEVLHKNHLDTDVGNEGGYAPNIDSTVQAFDLILDAIKGAGYQPGQEIGLALDVGASELYDKEKRLYTFKIDNHYMLSDQLISLYRDWAHKYPIFSIEDGLAEDDFQGWISLTKEFERFKPLIKSEIRNPKSETNLKSKTCPEQGRRIINQKFLVVGDDLFTTNINRLKTGVSKKLANAVIIKPNQIGTLSETIRFAKYARKHDYTLITSHRSGETCDDFIADLAVAIGSDFVKFGSLSRGERVSKYNRLMEIENN